MARDLLCIPLAGVGVERLFNFSRDVCSYRRGQLKPPAIRALMLVFFSQLQEERGNELRRILSDTIDVDSMTEEEMEAEVKERENSVGLRQKEVSTWGVDHYISDEEEGEPNRTGYQARTVRAQRRLDAIAHKRLSQARSVAHDNTQVLSVSTREILSTQIAEIERRNAAQDMAIYALPEDSEDEDILEQRVNRDSDSVESVLPTLPPGSVLETPRGLNTPRKRVRDSRDARSLIDRELAKRART
jgi:hypothetical protein